MKTRITALALTLLAFTGIAGAAEVQTVLTPNNVVFAIADGASAQLELSRRKADVREKLVVPGTNDAAIDSDARLLWDGATSTLFVVWHKASADRDAVVLATLDASGVWSEPVVIASCSSQRRSGLQTALTHVPAATEGDKPATLLHAAWWGVGSDLVAEYALVAFEGGKYVSTDVEALKDFASRKADAVDEFEDTGLALHPPLAIAPSETDASIDVVYGAPNSTKITRVRLEPRLVKGDARIWKPLGRGSEISGPARLIASDSAPVQAFLANGRVVLYRPDEKFRFVVLQNGVWSPERMIQAGGQLTTEQLLRELRRSVAENGPMDQGAPEK
ncbi:MAG: hypothetical protein M3Q69_03265 [Acidobacteriota bacterium]|nr:hypothetical protein [Acidobacteriota bacterium]